jgi:chemotaxis protein MotA
MNLSTPTGLIFAIGVVIGTISLEIKNPKIFLSPHAALMVIGGTVAAALICFPFATFLNLFKVFFFTLMGRGQRMIIETINEIVRISVMVNEGQSIAGETGKVKNEFLKECLELLQNGGLNDDELEDVLDKRIELQNEKYKREGMTFKIIGKFPPAFGLVGASMGMIALLQGLGEPNAFEHLGPSMAVALVATFYGLILANFFLIPLGENLTRASEEDLVMRRLVVDGVMLIKEEKHPLLVEEYLKSYIAPAERNKMKKSAAA